MSLTPFARTLLALVCVALVAGCVTTNATPTPPPTPSPVAPSVRPVPTAQAYVVRQGDTLTRIANRFELTVGQLLTANPSITDPDRLTVGQSLVIPPPGAPDTSPGSGGITDARDDFTDPDEQPVFGEGYADIDAVTLRTRGKDLVIEVGLTSRPPAAIDPEYESLLYTVVIDVDDDDQPDHRLKYGNDGEASGTLSVSLEDRHTGAIAAGTAFPGSFTVRNTVLVWTLPIEALGGGTRWRIAAKAERSFYPGGRSDPEVESTLDFAPNQQWPRPNPRWVELGAPIDPEA